MAVGTNIFGLNMIHDLSMYILIQIVRSNLLSEVWLTQCISSQPKIRKGKKNKDFKWRIHIEDIYFAFFVQWSKLQNKFRCQAIIGIK